MPTTDMMASIACRLAGKLRLGEESSKGKCGEVRLALFGKAQAVNGVSMK